MQTNTATLKTIKSIKNGYFITVDIKQTTYELIDGSQKVYQYFLFKAKRPDSPYHRFTEKVKLGFTKTLPEIEAIINQYITIF